MTYTVTVKEDWGEKILWRLAATGSIEFENERDNVFSKEWYAATEKADAEIAGLPDDITMDEIVAIVKEVRGERYEAEKQRSREKWLRE